MDLTIGEMMQLQQELFAPHAGEWHPMEPEYGKDFLLYMVEEMADVPMYYNDVLLRYHVTPEEISESYMRKHEKNMGRNFTKEYEEQYHG